MIEAGSSLKGNPGIKYAKTAATVVKVVNNASKVAGKGEAAADASMEQVSKMTEPDTTFTTTRAGSIETQVISSNQVSSFGNVEKVEVTVPKSKVDSVNNASQQSLDGQSEEMNAANVKLLNLL